MKLKGLVWFFSIALIIISVWELSYTWAVKNYEESVRTKAEQIVKKEAKSLPGLSVDDKEAMVNARMQRILDSTKDKDIYFGTTYQKCKESELNLGLDLQGGMSVTMDVSLEGLIKSLSNNPRDLQLQAALKSATALKVSSEADYISLFGEAYIKQNGSGKLSSLFAGPGKEIKITDNDDAVLSKIKTVAKGAINQTYKILVKRIDKFGVAQPNINLDENKGVINVELAGVKDPARVRKFLQSSANLQFWEVYRIDELAESLKLADQSLQAYLNGTDSAAAKDTAKAKQNANPFFKVMEPINPQQDANGKTVFAPAIGNVQLKDTGLFLSYISNEIVKGSLPSNLKFLFGSEEKTAKGNIRFFPSLCC